MWQTKKCHIIIKKAGRDYFFQKVQEPFFSNTTFIFILNILTTKQFQNSIHILGFKLQVVTQFSSVLSACIGHMSTTTTIIDGKNGSVPSSSMKVGKKSVTEDLVTTFSSPAAWLLVVALIVTWSAVAIVMFDLVDYKALAGKIQHILFDTLYIQI